MITGHSLGAGVASVLSMLLYQKEEFQSLQCFAFAPPGGLLRSFIFLTLLYYSKNCPSHNIQFSYFTGTSYNIETCIVIVNMDLYSTYSRDIHQSFSCPRITIVKTGFLAVTELMQRRTKANFLLWAARQLIPRNSTNDSKASKLCHGSGHYATDQRNLARSK